MIKITASRRVCLGRMIIPLGNRRDGPTNATSWTWLPASKGNEFRIEIPVKLIEEILAKKRAQLASAPPAPLPALKRPRPSQSLQLLLARVIVPLKTPPEWKEGHGCGPDAPNRVSAEQNIAAEEIRKRLLTEAFGVMNVMTARDKPPVKGATTNVLTFTINDDNNITLTHRAGCHIGDIGLVFERSHDRCADRGCRGNFRSGECAPEQPQHARPDQPKGRVPEFALR